MTHARVKEGLISANSSFELSLPVSLPTPSRFLPTILILLAAAQQTAAQSAPTMSPDDRLNLVELVALLTILALLGTVAGCQALADCCHHHDKHHSDKEPLLPHSTASQHCENGYESDSNHDHHDLHCSIQDEHCIDDEDACERGERRYTPCKN